MEKLDVLSFLLSAVDICETFLNDDAFFCNCAHHAAVRSYSRPFPDRVSISIRRLYHRRVSIGPPNDRDQIHIGQTNSLEGRKCRIDLPGSELAQYRGKGIPTSGRIIATYRNRKSGRHAIYRV